MVPAMTARDEMIATAPGIARTGPPVPPTTAVIVPQGPAIVGMPVAAPGIGSVVGGRSRRARQAVRPAAPGTPYAGPGRGAMQAAVTTGAATTGDGTTGTARPRAEAGAPIARLATTAPAATGRGTAAVAAGDPVATGVPPVDVLREVVRPSTVVMTAGPPATEGPAGAPAGAGPPRRKADGVRGGPRTGAAMIAAAGTTTAPPVSAGHTAEATRAGPPGSVAATAIGPAVTGGPHRAPTGTGRRAATGLRVPTVGTRAVAAAADRARVPARSHVTAGPLVDAGPMTAVAVPAVRPTGIAMAIGRRARNAVTTAGPRAPARDAARAVRATTAADPAVTARTVRPVRGPEDPPQHARTQHARTRRVPISRGPTRSETVQTEGTPEVAMVGSTQDRRNRGVPAVAVGTPTGVERARTATGAGAVARDRTGARRTGATRTRAVGTGAAAVTVPTVAPPRA